MLTLTNTPPTPAQTASRLYFHVAQDNHFMIKSLTDHAILYESDTYTSREEATAAAISKYREITPSTDAPTPHKPSASAPKTAATPKTDAEPVQLALIAPLPITEAAGAIKVNAKELYKAIKSVKFSNFNKTLPILNYMKIELTDAGIVIKTFGFTAEECKTAEPVHFWGNGERWKTCAPMITKAAIFSSRGIDTGRTKNVNPFLDYVKIHADDNETINLTLDPKTQNLTAQVGRSKSIFKCIDAQEWPAATTAAAINPEPETSAATPYIKFNIKNEIARREESINQLGKRLEAAEAAAINPTPTTSAPAAILENEAGAATEEEAINPDSEMRRRVAAYAAKRNAKIERITKAAQRTEAEAGARLDTARKMAAVIPFGQPILIGHHSEKRDRNYRGRIEGNFRKGFAMLEKAQKLKEKAETMQENDVIYSDNPQAAELLTDKLTELKAEQAEMKRINAALRKGADFETLPMSEAHRAELLIIDRVQNYYQPLKRGFPPYKLTNLNAKIKAAEKRAAQVEKKQAIPDKDEEINGIKIEWRASENRIRVIFPSRVDMDTYKKLKHHGYRAMKEAGTFSAFYNYHAGEFINDLRKAAD